MFGSSAPDTYALTIIKKKKGKIIVKKIIMIVAMVLATSLTANAEAKTSFSDLERYELKVNNKRVAKYLELDDKQSMFLELFHERMNNRLTQIYYDGGGNDKVMKEVESETRMLGNWLSRKQYGKYVELINLTFQNRGFEVNISDGKRKKS